MPTHWAQPALRVDNDGNAATTGTSSAFSDWLSARRLRGVEAAASGDRSDLVIMVEMIDDARRAAKMRQLVDDAGFVPHDAMLELAATVVNTRPWRNESGLAASLRGWRTGTGARGP
jgi:hypothetical protein